MIVMMTSAESVMKSVKESVEESVKEISLPVIVELKDHQLI